jgi:hypothetical protein
LQAYSISLAVNSIRRYHLVGATSSQTYRSAETQEQQQEHEHE